MGAQTRVCLAGVGRDDSLQVLKLAVRQAAEAAIDFSWLSKGDVVFVKPALNSGNPYPATTSPVAIQALVEMLKEKGARRVLIGDMSGIPFVKLTPKRLWGSSRRLWDDRVLNHSYEVFGGMPQVGIEAANEALTCDLMKRLTEMTIRPT